MYNYLKGVLAEASPNSVTLEVNGIGFSLMIPLSTSSKLPEIGQNVHMLVHHVVREDAQLLFGFITEEERLLFRLLIGVSGVGPKLAITTLSGLGIQDLKRAIVEGKIPTLTSIAGIGKRTAERLVIELREKIVVQGLGSDLASGEKPETKSPLMEDSLQALVSLGYSLKSAKVAVQKALETQDERELKPDVLVRESLKYI